MSIISDDKFIRSNNATESFNQKKFNPADLVGIADKNKWEANKLAAQVRAVVEPSESDKFKQGDQVKFITRDNKEYIGRIANKASNNNYIVNISDGESYLVPEDKLSSTVTKTSNIRQAIRSHFKPEISLVEGSMTRLANRCVVQATYKGFKPSEEHIVEWAKSFKGMKLVDAIDGSDRKINLVFEVIAAEDTKPQGGDQKTRGEPLSSEEIEGTGVIAKNINKLASINLKSRVVKSEADCLDVLMKEFAYVGPTGALDDMIDIVEGEGYDIDRSKIKNACDLAKQTSYIDSEISEATINLNADTDLDGVKLSAGDHNLKIYRIYGADFAYIDDNELNADQALAKNYIKHSRTPADLKANIDGWAKYVEDSLSGRLLHQSRPDDNKDMDWVCPCGSDNEAGHSCWKCGGPESAAVGFQPKRALKLVKDALKTNSLKELTTAIAKSGGWICGGAVRDMFVNVKPKDIDLFVAQNTKRAWKRILKEAGFKQFRNYFIIGNTVIDLVGIDKTSAIDVVKDFDIDVCQWYMNSNGDLTPLNSMVLEATKSKIATHNGNDKFGTINRRLSKLAQKGWSVIEADDVVWTDYDASKFKNDKDYEVAVSDAMSVDFGASTFANYKLIWGNYKKISVYKFKTDKKIKFKDVYGDEQELDPGDHKITVELRYGKVDVWLDDEHAIHYNGATIEDGKNTAEKFISDYNILSGARRPIDKEIDGEIEEECSNCKRMKDKGQACWWCGAGDPNLTPTGIDKRKTPYTLDDPDYDASKKAQQNVGQELVRAARWVLARFNDSNPGYYAIPQEHEIAGDDIKVARLHFMLNKKDGDSLNHLYISRSGELVDEDTNDGVKIVRGFVQVDSEANLPVIMLETLAGPESVQEYGFSFKAESEIKKLADYDACSMVANEVLGKFGEYNSDAQAEFDARLVKLAVDPTAKKYWSGYFKDYGKMWTRDIPRKKPKKSSINKVAVDEAAKRYWIEYFGAYGQELVRDIPKKINKQAQSEEELAEILDEYIKVYNQGELLNPYNVQRAKDKFIMDYGLEDDDIDTLLSGLDEETSQVMVEPGATLKSASDYAGYIKEIDGKYEVRSKKNSKWSGGTYDSKEKAEERLKQVEMFKHMSAYNLHGELALALDSLISKRADSDVNAIFGLGESKKKKPTSGAAPELRDISEVAQWAIEIADKDDDMYESVYALVHRFLSKNPGFLKAKFNSSQLTPEAVGYTLVYALRDSKSSFNQFKKMINKYMNRWQKDRWKGLQEESKNWKKEKVTDKPKAEPTIDEEELVVDPSQVEENKSSVKPNISQMKQTLQDLKKTRDKLNKMKQPQAPAAQPQAPAAPAAPTAQPQAPAAQPQPKQKPKSQPKQESWLSYGTSSSPEYGEIKYADKLKDKDNKMNTQPAKNKMKFDISRMYSTSSSEDSGYIIMDIGWNPDNFTNMSDQNIQQQIISFVKGLESTKEYHDFGVLGRIRVMDFDSRAGVACVKVRAKETKGIPTLGYDGDIDNPLPIKGIR